PVPLRRDPTLARVVACTEEVITGARDQEAVRIGSVIQSEIQSEIQRGTGAKTMLSVTRKAGDFDRRLSTRTEAATVESKGDAERCNWGRDWCGEASFDSTQTRTV